MSPNIPLSHSLTPSVLLENDFIIVILLVILFNFCIVFELLSVIIIGHIAAVFDQFGEFVTD